MTPEILAGRALTRSEFMARIRSRGNQRTEIAMIALFRLHGITGWRRHQPLPGRPDFIFRKERVAVFVDGCFWHGCPRHYREPKTGKTYWRRKLTINRKRDRRVRRTLRQLGWKVFRAWECDLAKEAKRTHLMRKLQSALR